MITPTVGRVVWFFPHGSDLHASPLAAIVTAVWSETRVNLVVFGADGVPLPTPPNNVLFVHEDSERPASGRCYCTWPTRESAAASTLSVQGETGEVYAMAIGDRLRGAFDFFGWLKSISGSIEVSLLDDIWAAYKDLLAADDAEAKLTAALTLAELLAAATKETQVDDQIVTAAKTIAEGPLRDLLLTVIERAWKSQPKNSIGILSLSPKLLTVDEEAAFTAAAIDPQLVLTIVQLLLKFWGNRGK